MRADRPELLLALSVLLMGLTAVGLTLPQPVIGAIRHRLWRGAGSFCYPCRCRGPGLFCSRRADAAQPAIGADDLDHPGQRRDHAGDGGRFFPPFLSNDMYRYIWDGWVQGAGINPYRFIPADPHLAFLRDAAVFPNINRADYAHTIYPPAAEMIFFLVSGTAKLLAVPPVLAMKVFMLGFEGVGIWAMLQLLDLAGLPRARILIYAWNPVTVWEFAGSGHVDAIAICFIALALLAVCKGLRGWGAAALAAAVLTKFLPVILLPALWRRWDWKFAAIFIAVIALLYAPYLGVGKAVLGFLGGYGAQEGIDSGQGIFFACGFRPAGRAAGVCVENILVAAGDGVAGHGHSNGVWAAVAGGARGCNHSGRAAQPIAGLRVDGRIVAALSMVLLLAADPGLHPALVERIVSGDGDFPALPQSDPYRTVLAGFFIRAVRGSGIAGCACRKTACANEPATG